MNILLIYPPFLEKRVSSDDVNVLPMGLFYIGALLIDNGFKVTILNLQQNPQTNAAFADLIRSYRPDIIGFSILNGNRWGGIDLATLAKQIDPSIQIVFGGPGATFLWQHLMNHFPVIDTIVVGEGEYPFLHLSQALQENRPDAFSQIKGLVIRTGREIRYTGKQPRIQDLDTLPDPSRYFTYQHLSFSRGCPGNCSFCGSPQIWERRVQFHSPAYFVGQVKRLVQKGVSFFYFSDDTFTLKKKPVIEICKAIIAQNLPITWAAISHVRHIDEEMLYWMRKAGCSQISYGIESGSEAIRLRLNKSIPTERIVQTFHMTTRYGILARAYIIYGCPGESEQTIQETIDLLERIKPLGVVFYILDMFPGTALFDQYQKQFGIPEDIWLDRIEDILYFENDPDLSRDQVLAFGEKLRQSFYRNLPRYATSIELVDRPELRERHADFCSRLAMTFSHGDYARIDRIPDKQKTAEWLYRKALAYAPNHHAFLGLGVIQQRKRDFEASIATLGKGIEHFPESEALHTCIGISYMNRNRPEQALPHFEKFPESEQACRYAAKCNKSIRNRQET